MKTLAVTNNRDAGTNLNSGRIEVFSDNFNAWATVPLLHIWQTAANSGWSSWQSLGGNVFGVVVAQNQDGRLEAFSIDLPLINGTADSLHIWQTTPGGGWSSWESLGGNVSQIAVAQNFRLPLRSQGNGTGQNQDGRLEVFGISGHGTLLHIWQTAPNSSWSAWETIGSGYQVFEIVVGQNQDGRLEVFATDQHGTMLHIWQTVPNGGWSDWEPLGSGYQVGGLAVCQNQDGRLEVFARDFHGTVLHIWQTVPNGGWSDWEPLGSGYQMAQLAAVQNQDGRLEVFAISIHGTPFHIWQLTPGGGWAAAWDFLGSGHNATDIVVGQNEDGRLEVFDMDVHGTVFHTWQTVPNGGWSAWAPL